MLPNLFSQIGKSEAEIDAKIANAFHTIFEDEEERFYFEMGGDKGYMLDTGNIDARTEGMSYGMMMAVQMDRRDIFDRLWNFSMAYMHHAEGKYEGYFAWSVKPDGTRNHQGPAPDGEEYYAMALFFAAARWNEPAYADAARDILRHCVHQHELVEDGRAMWDPDNHYIRFVPEADFSDPSYHLPHFYALFAKHAGECDRAFWQEASEASHRYIVLSCHPKTGMASEYAEYDGTPRLMFGKPMNFYSDAYRVAMNIGLDAAWFGKTPELTAVADNLQRFFSEQTEFLQYDSYMLDGTPIGQEAMHPHAIVSTLAAASLAAEGKYRLQWVENLWNLPLRKGVRRYYDNCLHFFCLLMLTGRYRIFE